MRPKTVIIGVAIAALVVALLLLLIEVKRPGGEVDSAPAASQPAGAARLPADASETPVPAGDDEPALEPASPTAAAAGQGAKERPDTPKIYVRPVPGAQVPDEITADNLADITLQRDAAPEGSEIARAQAVKRLHRQRRYAEALDEALAVLDDFPDNTGVRRTVVSIACVQRDAELAREHYAKLPETLKRRLSSRCEKYGVELEDDLR